MRYNVSQCDTKCDQNIVCTINISSFVDKRVCSVSRSRKLAECRSIDRRISWGMTYSTGRRSTDTRVTSPLLCSGMGNQGRIQVLQQSTSLPRSNSWVMQTRLWQLRQGIITLTSVMEEMPFTIQDFPWQVRRLWFIDVTPNSGTIG